MKINKALKFGKELLGNNSSLDVEVLVAFLAGISREQLFTREKEIDKESLVALFEMRKKGMPVAQIIGKKEFYGFEFVVNENCMIPRPETEMIVDNVLEFCKSDNIKSDNPVIFDIGAGSGAVGLSIARLIVDSKVICIEKCEKAASVASSNIKKMGIDNANVVISDLLSNIEDNCVPDILVANLPYIGEKKYRFVASDVEKYEPKIALFGGYDGLDLYRQLFVQIKEMKYFERGLKMFMGEFGFAQADDVANMIESEVNYSYKIIPDLSGIDRFFKIIN